MASSCSSSPRVSRSPSSGPVALALAVALLGCACVDLGDRVLLGADGGEPDDGGADTAEVDEDQGPPPADTGPEDRTSEGGDPVSPPDLPPDLPPAGPSFSGDVQPIFNTACATPNCHVQGTVTVNGLFLEAARAYAALVNVRAVGRPEQTRVVPGNADTSYLYLKITATVGDARIAGMPMPLQRPPLGQAERDTIRSWINAGALND